MSSELENFLSHYGKKGMKWGVATKSSKAKLPMHKDYDVHKQTYDRQIYGKGTVKRVNNALHQGKNLKEAREQAHKTQNRKALAGYAVMLGAYVVARNAPRILNTLAPAIDRGVTNLDRKAGDIAFKRYAAKGMKQAATILADNRGLPAKETYSAVYDAASNMWR